MTWRSFTELYQPFEEGEGSDSRGDKGETGEGAAVVGGEDLPFLQVGGGPVRLRLRVC
jgi:hypothetical protein